jgi:hypothetical protein
MRTALSERFARNADEIAADVVDGEAVIINLANGTYYSLDATATCVWEALDTPRSLEELADVLVARFEVGAAQALEDCTALLRSLADEALVTVVPAGDRVAAASVTMAAQRLAYVAPRLSKYTDMADMLALDPPLPGLKDLPWKTTESQ